ncbi:MAG TPA: HNH endonuclease, partial [Pseudobdellovibrionaceae bacterium]|nr:HNH endonuclease [Pseudobdellovibrionaceae bacterium]
ATTANTSRLALELPNETLELITQLKGALAHKHPNMTTAELITLLAREKLAALRPAPAQVQPTPKQTPAPTDAAQPTSARNTQASPKRSRYIPKKLRRKIQHEAQHKCANCGSHHALEIDHIHPYAQGGTHAPTNLRALCRNCNQRRIRSPAR